MLDMVTLSNIVPHGSGIDSNWFYEKKKCGTIHVSNSYHHMNDAGYYTGYIDFTVIVPIKNPLDFKLQFNGGNRAQYYSKRYMLREYLEDTIYQSIAGGLEEGKVYKDIPYYWHEN